MVCLFNLNFNKEFRAITEMMMIIIFKTTTTAGFKWVYEFMFCP